MFHSGIADTVVDASEWKLVGLINTLDQTLIPSFKHCKSVNIHVINERSNSYALSWVLNQSNRNTIFKAGLNCLNSNLLDTWKVDLMDYSSLLGHMSEPK